MGDANFNEKTSIESLRRCGDLKCLTKHDSPTRKGGGDPLIIKVEDTFHRQVAEDSEKKLTGPLVSWSKRSTSASELQEVRRCDTRQGGCFPFLWGARDVKSKETHENGHSLPKTQIAAITDVENPITDVAMRVSREEVTRPTSNNDRQVDLAFTHSFRNNHNKAVGDFTSVTFEPEDFIDIEENDEIRISTLSLPNTEEADLTVQVLRPYTSVSKVNSLFVTSNSLGLHLPPLGEQVSLNGEYLTDLNHNLESWMSRLPRALQQLPLNHLYIPGNGNYSTLQEEAVSMSIAVSIYQSIYPYTE